MGSDGLSSGSWVIDTEEMQVCLAREMGRNGLASPHCPHLLVVSPSSWLRPALNQPIGEAWKCSLQGPASEIQSK